MEQRIPIIVTEFEYEGTYFQVIVWPETEEEPFEWDVVKADDPYAFRDYAEFYRFFDSP